MTLGNETKIATRTGKRSILQEKRVDCEQSIDISKFKIIRTQFDIILAKKQNRGHSRIFDSHPLTFKYIDLTSGGKMDDPTFAWTGNLQAKPLRSDVVVRIYGPGLVTLWLTSISTKEN